TRAGSPPTSRAPRPTRSRWCAPPPGRGRRRERGPPMTTADRVANGEGAALRLLRARELGIVLALALLLGVTAAANPRFLSGQSLRDLLLGATILTVLAIGQTLVIVTRNVDLSVGSILRLTAFATGELFLAGPATPILDAFPA